MVCSIEYLGRIASVIDAHSSMGFALEVEGSGGPTLWSAKSGCTTKSWRLERPCTSRRF